MGRADATFESLAGSAGRGDAPKPGETGGPASGVEVSVVMPCLNEARTVGRCVEKARAALESLGVPGEVIVADNGSSDGSADLALAHGARLVRVEARGYGSAIRGGVTATRGRYIIVGDADGSYDFGHLGPFVARLRRGDGLVMGNRFRGAVLPGAMPRLHRYLGNPLLTGLLNLLFRSPIRDAQCGLRAFRKDAYERWCLTSPGMELASEMVVKACLCGDTISEVPVVLHPDGRGRAPHLRSFRDGCRNLGLLVSLWLRGWPPGCRREVKQGPAGHARAMSSPFDATHYARGLRGKLERSLQLGPGYYFRDLPRYLAHRRALGLSGWDVGAFLNPLREFRPGKQTPLPPPPGYAEALRRLAAAGVRLTLPPARLEALAGAWWAAREVAGDVMECGSYRGATALLLALLGRMHQLRQVTFLLDTFLGAPEACRYDVSRSGGEFTPPPDQVELIRQQATALGVLDRVELHQGLFTDTFRRLERRPLRLAFVHVDANLYQSTREACMFTLPRVSPGGLVVFDDYNGVLDLGARLAIDHSLAGDHVKLLPLSGSSAYLRLPAREGP